MRALFLASIAATSMALSASAPADLFRPSQSDQIKLGQRAASDLRKSQKVLPASDPRVELVRRVGYRLLSTVHKKEPWQYSFDVIQAKDVNAFALPGGPTFVYTGLLDKIKTEDELAGVLGHELTHVRREHWATQYADSQKRAIGLNLLLIFAHANSTLGNLASIGNEVIFNLPFSRKMEAQADDGGFDMMTAAGYNPQGEADVFQMLHDLAKSGSPPEFLSDHPSDQSRINHIEDRIRQSGRTYRAQRPIRSGWND